MQIDTVRVVGGVTAKEQKMRLQNRISNYRIRIYKHLSCELCERNGGYGCWLDGQQKHCKRKNN